MTEEPMTTPRRTLLKSLAIAPIAAATGLASPWARAAAQEAGLVAANVCLLSPETTEGPFYFDPALVRADITEGRPGLPLDLAIQVVDAECRPLEDARVDIWHCDAAGSYSGYSREGTQDETFLRGTQLTGAEGVARFISIYPGWYRGRAVHVHYKVFLDRATVLTSQLFFPDAVSDEIYAGSPAYADRTGQRSTLNTNDGIARRAGEGAIAELRREDGRAVAALVVGVAG